MTTIILISSTILLLAIYMAVICCFGYKLEKKCKNLRAENKQLRESLKTIIRELEGITLNDTREHPFETLDRIEDAEAVAVQTLKALKSA